VQFINSLTDSDHRGAEVDCPEEEVGSGELHWEPDNGGKHQGEWEEEHGLLEHLGRHVGHSAVEAIGSLPQEDHPLKDDGRKEGDGAKGGEQRPPATGPGQLSRGRI